MKTLTESNCQFSQHKMSREIYLVWWQLSSWSTALLGVLVKVIHCSQFLWSECDSENQKWGGDTYMERLVWHRQADLRSLIWSVSDELIIILRSMMQCPDISMLVTGMRVTLRSAGLNRVFVWPHDRIGFAEWYTWYAWWQPQSILNIWRCSPGRGVLHFWLFLFLCCQYVKCCSIITP